MRNQQDQKLWRMLRQQLRPAAQPQRQPVQEMALVVRRERRQLRQLRGLEQHHRPSPLAEEVA